MFYISDSIASLIYFPYTYMKKTITILITIIAFSYAKAQAPAIQWQKSFGGSGLEYWNACIQKTTDGGYILAGTGASLDGDVIGNHALNPALISGDFWVVKLDAAGTIVWQKELGGTEDEFCYSIQQTVDGGYVVAGTSTSNDGDVTGHHLSEDVWIVKLDAAGTLMWQKSLGGNGYDNSRCIQQTTDGGYIVAGYSNSLNGDLTINHGNNDYWIVKLDATGTLLWQKSFGGSGDDRAYYIQQTSDGGYIVAGSNDSTNGDVTGNHGGSDAWIIKLDATGTLMWQKSFGNTGVDAARCILQTTDGGYIFSGYRALTNSETNVNHGGKEAWIVKLDTTGTEEWQKLYGGSGYDEAVYIKQANDGSYILAGDTSNGNGDVTGFHSPVCCGPVADYWILKLDASGTLLWQKALGGSNIDTACSIQQTSDGGYITAGYSYSTDGDVIGNHGSYDYWVVKLGADSLGINRVSNKNLTVYPNPAKENIYIQLPGENSIDKIIITDLVGKKVSEQNQNNNEIAIKDISSGMYIIQVFSGGEKFTSKFIKE